MRSWPRTVAADNGVAPAWVAALTCAPSSPPRQRTTASGSVIFEDVRIDSEEQIIPVWQRADVPGLAGPVSHQQRLGFAALTPEAIDAACRALAPLHPRR